MIKLVQQEGDYDAGAACLAMALGLRKASDIYPWLGYNPNEERFYVTIVELMNILCDSNRTLRYQYTREVLERSSAASKGKFNSRVNLPSEQALRSQLNRMQVGCAIVGVEDPRNAVRAHYMMCYKGEVLDPATHGARFTGSAYALPVEFAIFIEETP